MTEGGGINVADRDVLKQCGYSNEMLAKMNDEDCEVEIGYLSEGSDIIEN